MNFLGEVKFGIRGVKYDSGRPEGGVDAVGR